MKWGEIMESKKKSIINRFFTASIILFPILNSAHIGDMNFGFGDVLLVLTYMLVLFWQGRSIKLKINKDSSLFWIYIIYLCVVSVMNCFIIPGFEFSSILGSLVRYAFYGLIIFSNRKYADYEYGIKFYINVCLMEAIYGLIQFFLTLTFGIVLPYVLPFTTMEYGVYGADYNAQLLSVFQNVDGIRLVGFSPEPSHFAQYTVFSIIFLLYKKNRRKIDFVKLCVISIAILLTKSSIGIIALLFVITFYMVTERHLNVRKAISRIGIISISILVAVILNNRYDVITFIQERISSINERTYAVSGNLRLIRGYMVYSKAPWNIKIFGIGCGNYANFVNQFNISIFFDNVMDKTNEYMSASSLLLVRTGAIGAMIFFFFCTKLFVHLNKIQKIIFFVWIELFFSENLFFVPRFVLIMWFMVSKFDMDSLLYIDHNHCLRNERVM